MTVSIAGMKKGKIFPVLELIFTLELKANAVNICCLLLSSAFGAGINYSPAEQDNYYFDAV